MAAGVISPTELQIIYHQQNDISDDPAETFVII